jgi:formylglycine-generating enzyme required for sulfatase activity
VTKLLAAGSCVALAACGRFGFDTTATVILDARHRADSADSPDGPVGAVDGPPTLSCAGLAATCGPAGTSSCCGSPLVTGGTFFRGDDAASDGMFTDTSDPATVSDFRLDTYEVTVGRFRQFVNAGVGTQADPPATGVGARTLNGMASQAGWDPTWTSYLTDDTGALVAALVCASPGATWTDTAGANEALPINCITWYEAFAFCAWDGGFLPTEAEWHYAASGGSEQRAYPWSNPAGDLTIDCAHANYNGCVGAKTRVGTDSPAGDGLYGQADLGGNVWEWILDSDENAYLDPCDDCADLSVQPAVVIRNGDDGDDAASLRSASRNSEGPTDRDEDIGVRCARAP